MIIIVCCIGIATRVFREITSLILMKYHFTGVVGCFNLWIRWFGKSDIAKVNWKYECPENRYYAWNDIKGAVQWTVHKSRKKSAADEFVA